LDWVYFLSTKGLLSADKITLGVDRYLRTYYSSMRPEMVYTALRAFKRADEVRSRAELLAVCEGSATRLAQLEGHQIVLPQDFWSPEDLILSPEMHFIHAHLPTPAQAP
jgi:hypothetical protein